MCTLLQNVDILKDAETVRQLGSILKTNVRACKAVGHPFVVQLGRIYLDMLNVYKCLSENISSAVQTNGLFLLVCVCVSDILSGTNFRLNTSYFGMS